MQKRKRSIGELISNFVFFFIAIWAFTEGKLFFDQEQYLKCFFVYLGGLLSFLATFRFQVQNLINRLRSKK